MNPSTALATVLVDELVRQGVREAVLCPGSRNAPLSFALHDADRAGRLRLHVRIDERTAGFLALGLAKASGLPVPVVTTSGTAAVNVHPAVVEADYSGVRLVVLTADRPAEMRGTGANQSIDQVRLYGGSVRFFAELSVEEPVGVAGWRDLVGRALVFGRDGPVHLNVAFREPLLPAPAPHPPSAANTPARARVSRAVPERSGVVAAGSGGRPPGDPIAGGPRTVVVAGDRAAPGVRTLAQAAGWPLLAEPSSGARAGPNALGTYRLWLDSLAPEVERVVVAGRPTLSRPVTRLLAREDVEIVRLGHHLPTPAVTGTADAAWLRRWTDADRAARDAVEKVLAEESMNLPGVARVVAAAVPPDGLLVAGSSSAVRDLDLADPWDESPLVLANRGASGIDGTVSTAIGAALAHGGPAYALMGDLTFLHDSTGLVIGPDEPRPDLTIVVVNDDGGGLFTQLEQGAPEHAAVFERVFGTPHGANLRSLCAATGTAY
ncbi:MAG: 2-succinyl-5-enolpyruvyl-6-hydroxy-3-cyclohexene-1-carboxylic-acid synthase, partial [Spirochaetaceae bacterium]|nr:2-succinyl-5-enolpyruvyl-6-hydroxy-3-cyclohexene-1-carboxylic-acid synthase [Spirochaetaceae bacterium]